MSDADKWNSVHEKITTLARNQSQLRERVDTIMQTVNSHDAAINSMLETQKMMRELVDLFNSLKGGITVIGWIGVFIKWLWPIAATALAVWVYLKTGEWKIKP